MLGSIIATVSGIGYSLRLSFLKDLKKYNFGKSTINFYYRVLSLPLIIIMMLLINEKIVLNNPKFLIIFVISLFLNVIYTLYQVFVYQRSQFSNVESFSFLEIIFSTLLALIFFKQVLQIKEIVGIMTIVFGLLILTVKKTKIGDVRELVQIVFYYLIYSLVHNFNQQATYLSSPITYALLTTIGLVVANFVIMLINHNDLNYKISKGAFSILAITGFLTALSFIGSTYSYKLLPVGIAVTLFDTKVFFSLWLSHKKYGEKNLGYKVFASVLAFVGVIILFL